MSEQRSHTKRLLITVDVVILAAWTLWWVISSAMDVGEMSKPTRYEWWLPLAIGFMCAFPAYLGYCIGKDIHKSDEELT